MIEHGKDARMDELKMMDAMHFMPGLLQSPRVAACGRLIYEEDQYEAIIKTTIKENLVTCPGCLAALQGREKGNAHRD